MSDNKTTLCEAAAISSVNEHGVRRHSHPLSQAFAVFAQKTASLTGHPVAFLIAAGTILVWIVSGPIFHFSDTWQLIINTGTTIVTFLMVFLIQNTQNRDMLSMQLKLSELVLAMKGAEDRFATIEDLSDEELQKLHADCRARAEMTARQMASRAKPANAKSTGSVQNVA
ncbi:low affinity iron permease family protein [Undibacter mobilis]|uniref:Low affinity iron permease family protein n=1 Tax=Undibacter mobilis TaxID=2292256 RepID=A0A371B2W2_9BRAD|nr:low affinity iron permease family protein [Undibacter mobilis]RDV01926.1 low affinity iron permease family protein [Undibacter mobilis]